jgi:hypothetical protein
MDLPEEDSAALAKRRAIQALMRDRSLTAAERHARMQSIMRGIFQEEEEDDDDENEEVEEEENEENEEDSGSEYSEEEQDDDDDDDVGMRDDDDDDDDYEEEDDETSSSSHASSYSLASGGRSPSNATVSQSSTSTSGSASAHHPTRLSSSSSTNADAQELRRRALLEVSRDKTLSASARRRRMKDIMRSDSGGGAVGGDGGEIDDRSNPPISSPVCRPPDHGRRSRRGEKSRGGGGGGEAGSFMDSIRGPINDADDDVSHARVALSRGDGIASRGGVSGNNGVVNAIVGDVLRRMNAGDVTLTKIELPKMKLTDDDLVTMLEALGRNTTATRLNLRRNRLGALGCSTLASALLDNARLVSIDVSGNDLGDEGMTDLAKVLPHNATLEVLNVEDNRIGDVGARALAQALTTATSSLREVNLGGNLIGNDGASEIFRALGSSIARDDDGSVVLGGGRSAVSSLLLRFNAISDRGARDLASTLLDNETLRTVDLGHNKITNRGARDLIKVITINDTLERLELGGNAGIDDDVLDEVERALEGERGVVDDASSSSTDDSSAEEESSRGGDEGSSYDVEDDVSGRVELTNSESKMATTARSNTDDTAGSERSTFDGDDGGSMDRSAPTEDVRDLTGAKAMLRDMPDEDDITLRKRKAVLSVMQDRSLSALDRNRKIQDIMSGRVELPKVSTEKPARAASRRAREEKANTDSSENEQGSRRDSRNIDSTQKGAYNKNNVAGETKTKGLGGNGNFDDTNGNSSQVDVGAEVNATRKDALNDSLNASTSLRAKPVLIKGGSSMEATKNSLPKNDDQQPTNTAKPPNESFSLKRSNAGVMRIAIADQWKERMVTAHPRSDDDMLDILLAHQYRLSLKTPPRQSFFRVVAIVFFSRVGDGILQSERYYVVGTNDEPHSIGGSICAERAALMQLRFIPDIKEITKVVIVTDEVDAISPGMLCREFMASHSCISWDAPIILGRSVCRKCGFTVSGKICSDVDGCFSTTKSSTLRDANAELFATCTSGHEESKHKDYSTPHDFFGVRVTLRDLFPYPSLYARMTAKEAMKFGEDYINQETASDPLSKNEGNSGIRAHSASTRSDDGETVVSHRQDRFDLAVLTGMCEEVEMGNNAGVRQNQTSRASSNGTKGRLRNGAATLLQSNSLNTAISIIKRAAEDHQKLNISRLSGLSKVAALHRMSSRYIRLSERLKPSQRRQKLISLATEATALESHLEHVYPIRYGAAVLFSDGTVAIATQKVALEYGCTLDAVGQLASVIDRKALKIKDDSEPCRPIVLVQCDQFGIAHAPFAHGRAFLNERGYGECKILLHQLKKGKNPVRGEDENQGIVGGNSTDENIDTCEIELRLLEVDANDLAPSPPDVFGHLITRNHSQGGLQLQF